MRHCPSTNALILPRALRQSSDVQLEVLRFMVWSRPPPSVLATALLSLERLPLYLVSVPPVPSELTLTLPVATNDHLDKEVGDEGCVLTKSKGGA